MKKDLVISAVVLTAGVVLLIAGVANLPVDAGITIPGAILIGSWHIGRNLAK